MEYKIYEIKEKNDPNLTALVDLFTEYDNTMGKSFRTQLSIGSIASDIISTREGSLLIIEVENHPAGYIAMHTDRDKCTLLSIFIQSKYRGWQLSYGLAEALMLKAKEKGYATMQARMPFECSVAMHLLRRIGFIDVISIDDEDPNNQWMELDLEEWAKGKHLFFLGNPDLHTKRLLLRKFTFDDIPWMFAYASDPHATKYLTWNTHQRIRDSEEYIGYITQRYNWDQAGDWGIELKEAGHVIGSCGFNIVDNHNKCGQIGYVLKREYWGQGIISEAINRVLDFTFQEIRLERVEALIVPENKASERVLQKAGMHYEGLLQHRLLIRGEYTDAKLYSIVRNDFLNNSQKNILS